MAIKRLYDTLVGATVNVNQLVDTDTSSVTIQSGHKYYAKISGTESIGASTGTAIAVTGGTDMVVDLTAMLGSTIADYLYSLETATAGAGIAKLKEWGFFTGEYIPYNPGSLESVEARSHVMRGFNQWDEEWEAGTFDTTTGEPLPESRCLRSKNFIPVIPEATYYGFIGTNMYMTRLFYDSLYNYIGQVQGTTNGTFITPVGSAYMKFRTETAKYAMPYNHDICINLSNPDRNGEYEPYVSHTYDLGTDTLRGLFKLDSNNNLYADGDTKASDGVITRKMKSKTLEQIDVTYSPNNSGYANIAYARITKPSDAKGLNSANPLLILLDGYVTSSATFGWDTADKIGYLFYGADTAYWWVGFPHGTTVEQMKSTLAGKELVYELATPTTETSTPFQNPQICDPDGTEEYVTSNGVPVGHETRYQL